MDVTSTSGTTYTGAIFASCALPGLRSAVTKLKAPKSYWFSGIASNRLPYIFMQMICSFANLHELLCLEAFLVLKSPSPQKQLETIVTNVLSSSSSLLSVPRHIISALSSMSSDLSLKPKSQGTASLCIA